MRLQQNSLESRTFVLQCNQVLHTFGKYDIPWLRNLSELMYITNPKEFETKLLQAMGSSNLQTITPYTLVTNTKERKYVGGMWRFGTSPEIFESNDLETIRKQLEEEKYAYMSCLHVRDMFRGKMYGTELFSKALQKIMEMYPKAWGVVSEPELLHWYEYFGGKVQNCMNGNEDKLAIVTFDERTIRRR